jgi:hypothetical protein
MRWLKIALGFVLVLVAVFVVGGLLLPDRVELERSIHIERPSAQIYPLLDGFTRFNEWSPWRDYDPSAVYELSGPARGVGARMSWSGDKGGGSQEVIEAVPNDRVGVALDFGGDGLATAHHILIPEGDGTRVIWRFETGFEGSLAGRWFGLVFESMLGPDYERGLASLKQVAESEPVAVAPEREGAGESDLDDDPDVAPGEPVDGDGEGADEV